MRQMFLEGLGVMGIMALVLLGSGCLEEIPGVGTNKEEMGLPDQFYSLNPPGTIPFEAHPGYVASGAAKYAEIKGGELGLYDDVEKQTITKYNRMPTLEEYQRYGTPNLPGEYWYAKPFFSQVPVGTPLYSAVYKDPSTGRDWLVWSYEKIRWVKRR